MRFGDREDDLAGWRLAPELPVVDSAILLTGNSPAETDMEPNGLHDYTPVKRTSEGDVPGELNNRTESQRR